jgi:Zn finger protein HypA/HybF involved in hydrogenase expression
MKLIITEAQFDRLKKGISCLYPINFTFVENVTLRRGTRRICVNKEFNDKLRQHSHNQISKENNKIDSDLWLEICQYYKKAYHFLPEELTFVTAHSSSNNKDIGLVEVKYKFNPDVNETTDVDADKDAAFIRCFNCRRLFTQTTHKKKKSLPICPHCGTHNTKKK